MLNPSRSTGPPSTGKYVILQSRQASTSAGLSSNATTTPQQATPQPPQQQQQQQVKITQGTAVQQKTHLSTPATKLVVVCMPGSSHNVTSTVTQVCNY